MIVAAWISVAALGAALISRLVEPRKAEVRWDEASTWFSLVKELSATTVVIWVLVTH